MPHDILHSFDIDIDDSVKGLGIQMPQGSIRVDDGRVVDQQIRGSRFFHGRLDPCRHRSVIPDIHGLNTYAIGAVTGQGLQSLLIARTAKNSMTQGVESQSQSPAKALGKLL